MEDYGILKCRLLLVFLFSFWGLVLPLGTLAYDDKTTHPALTQEIIKFYNSKFSDAPLSLVDGELVIEGSVDEDSDPRYLNHFYDPVHQRGLTLPILGSWPSSKDWGMNTDLQRGWFQGKTQNYFSGLADYSWNRAVYDYVWGDRNRGLRGLGHILHLLEDASVPDHTRNDPHPPVGDLGSPYESWTARFVRSNIKIDGLENRSPVLEASIGDYFDRIAEYSNSNFFSKDTIFDSQFTSPKNGVPKSEIVGSASDNFIYSLDSFGNEYRLLEVKKSFDDRIEYFIKDDNFLVLSDYWRLLSREAVVNGAGVIKLFFDEVAKERQTHVLRDRNTSMLGKIAHETYNFLFGHADASPVALVLAEDHSTESVPIEVHTATGIVSSIPFVIPSTVNPTVSPFQTNPLEPALPPQTLTPQPVAPAVAPQFVLSPGFGGGAPQPASRSSSDDSLVATSPGSLPTADAIPPDVTFSIAECLSSFSPGGCLIATTTVYLVWSSDAPDLDSFELNQDGVSVVTNEIATTSPLGSGGSLFSITARDHAGNVSESKIIRVQVATSPVVINEVGWSGTRTSAGDQWIELFNPTESVIDLTDMVLFSKTKGTPFVPLAGTISPGGFYLIESASDDVVASIPADLVASFGEGISFSGERLAVGLKRSGEATTTLDETFFCSQWCGKGTALPATSMERYSASVSGTDLDNWDSNNKVMVFGRDRTADVIFGTPGSRNSISALVNKGRDITTGTVTLTKADGPYLVTRIQSISPAASLVAEPGVVVKFSRSGGLSVGGTLQALGSEGEPVAFVAFGDDEFGGDMDANGPLPPGADPDFWKGIKVLPSAADTIFRYSVVRNGNGEGNLGTNIIVTDAPVIFDHLTSERAFKVGLLLSHSNSQVIDSIFRDIPPHSSGAGSNFAFGILAESGGDQVYRRNQFIDVNSGLQTSGVGGTIEDNVFTRNAFRAIELRSFTGGRISGNTGTGNGNGQQGSVGDVLLLQGSVGVGASTTLGKSPGFSYLLDNQTVPLGGGLVVEPGVVVKYKANGLRVEGRLEVLGTPEEPVRFTSIEDDSDGSDAQSNGDGIPQILNFSGLTFLPSATSRLENTNIRFAFPAITYQDPSPVFLRNITFENVGLAVQGSPSSVVDLIENLTFLNVGATSSPATLLGI